MSIGQALAEHTLISLMLCPPVRLCVKGLYYLLFGSPTASRVASLPPDQFPMSMAGRRFSGSGSTTTPVVDFRHAFVYSTTCTPSDLSASPNAWQEAGG